MHGDPTGVLTSLLQGTLKKGPGEGAGRTDLASLPRPRPAGNTYPPPGNKLAIWIPEVLCLTAPERMESTLTSQRTVEVPRGPGLVQGHTECGTSCPNSSFSAPCGHRSNGIQAHSGHALGMSSSVSPRPPARAWVTGMSRRDHGWRGMDGIGCDQVVTWVQQEGERSRGGGVEGREGMEETDGEAEAGGSPWFCGWTQSSARAGSCRAPWTPHTGTRPGPRCRSCRRSRCSPAGGRGVGRDTTGGGWVKGSQQGRRQGGK